MKILEQLRIEMNKEKRKAILEKRRKMAENFIPMPNSKKLTKHLEKIIAWAKKIPLVEKK